MKTARPPFLLVCMLALATAQANTAQADMVRANTAQDSAVPSDTTEVRAAVEIRDAPIAVQALNTDLSMALSHAQGVFSHTFDAAGWPNGLSIWGMDPNHVRLEWDGRPVEDLLTGRPRFDMVPVALLGAASWTPGGAARADTDSLLTVSPLTRVRYESAGDGLQAVRALHVQNRFLRTSDTTGVRLQTVFGYAGAGAQGEYDGSQLKRAREVTARIGVEGKGWSAWIQDVASRRAVGAHAGVLPFTGATYESIYQRLGANVADPTARRRTVRNDLELGGATSWREWKGTLRAIRTSQTLDFEGSTLSVRGWTTRWQLRSSVTRNISPGTLQIDAHILRDAGHGGSAWASTPKSRSQSSLSASLQRDVRWSVKAGLVNGTHHSWWHAMARGQLDVGVLHVHGLLERSARRISLLEQAGFGTGIAGVSALSDIPLQETLLARAGMQVRRGVWQLGMDASHLREPNAITHRLSVSHPGLDSAILRGSRSRSVLSLSLGWRDDGRKGLYARVNGAISAASGPDAGETAVLWEQSLPRQWAGGRIGWRALLFQSDLDLDLYLRGRAWNSMTGLRLHTPTGLLVLPADASGSVEENWLVDIVTEGGVRGATLFFAYENMFSGTTLQVGNLIVPDYPLPRQRVRFGVYWPIAN